jgi:hypothetical protein
MVKLNDLEKKLFIEMQETEISYAFWKDEINKYPDSMIAKDLYSSVRIYYNSLYRLFKRLNLLVDYIVWQSEPD